MKVIVGTHNGMMKVINLDENVQTALFGKYGLNNSVETMCWADPDSEDLVGAGYTEGDVQFWNPLTKKLMFDCGKRGGKIKGLFTFEKESGRMVVSCTDNRQLEVCPIDLPEDYKHSFKRLEGNNESAIWRMRPNPLSPQHVLYAGKLIMPTLYDMEHQKTVWRGVFGNPKFYGLKQRQFFTDFQFMPESASVFATGSRYREFRIYDLRKGHAPVIDFDVTQTAEWEFAMISLAVTYHTPTIVYATEATGKIATFDLRTGKLHKIYRDGMGTVKSLAFHPTERTMGAVGLDRYLRVYDIDKRLQKINDKSSLEYRVRLPNTVGANMYNKMFLKQKLNSIMFFAEERMKKVMEDRAEERRDLQRQKADVKKEDKEGADEDDDEEEEKDVKKPIELEDGDDVWGDLQEVGDVKDEDDEDDGLVMNVKDEPDSDEDEDDETPKKSSKSNMKLKREKMEESDGDGEEDDDDMWDGLDEASGDEDDIKLGEFDEGENDGEGAEDEDDSDDDDEDEADLKSGKTNGTNAGNGKVKGEKKTDNKRKRRVAKEKEEKQKKLKMKKAAIVSAKKGRQLAKKRKHLSK